MKMSLHLALKINYKASDLFYKKYNNFNYLLDGFLYNFTICLTSIDL